MTLLQLIYSLNNNFVTVGFESFKIKKTANTITVKYETFTIVINVKKCNMTAETSKGEKTSYCFYSMLQENKSTLELLNSYQLKLDLLRLGE